MMTRICMISDTHEQHREVEIPECDVLLHAGDITMIGDYAWLKDFDDWIGELQEAETIKEAVIIPGNHDLTFENNTEVALSHMSNVDATLICDTAYVGTDPENLLTVWGVPWQLRFYDWGFNCNEEALSRYLREGCPDKIDILMTHGPPIGVRDWNRDGSPCGSQAVYDFIMDYQPKLVVCGHIHGAYGLALVGNTLVVNASTCDEDYNPTHEPVVIDI